MAAQINVSVYGINGLDLKNAQGTTFGFPAANCVIRTLNPALTYGGVVCLSAVQLLPTAPSPIQPVYYTPTAAATLITAGA